MKSEVYGDFLVVDHVIESGSETTMLNEIPGSSIYEVVKIQQGKPVFFEEHMARLKKSADFLNVEVRKTEAEILEEICWLVEKNRRDHINVKLLSTRTAGKDTFIIYFIPLERPENDPLATKGAHTILFSGERANPNIKTLKGSFRERVRNSRIESKAYEALLADENGYVTEGSRSNIFFVWKDGRLRTPPTARVLAGVTRAKVMDICERFDIPVEEGLVNIKELPSIPAAFITGTTVDVTPVGSIDDIKYDSAANPLVRKIVEAYHKEVADYIDRP